MEVQQTGQPDEPPKKRPRGRAFVKGGDARQIQFGAVVEGKDEKVVVPADLAGQTREDILHVYLRDKKFDKTAGQRFWRTIRESRPGDFKDSYMELVKASVPPGEVPSTPVPLEDAGAERIQAAIKELLKRMEGP